jgi:hypothetical protein
MPAAKPASKGSMKRAYSILISAAAFLIVVASMSISAQNSRSVPPVNEILERATESSKNYVETFKDLLAVETKRFETYKYNGAVKGKKTIVSTFLVYTSAINAGNAVEFRNVTSVDGKNIDKAAERAASFFEDIQKARTSAKEFEMLRDESLRFDERIQITGLTLFKSLAIYPALRPYFEFEVSSVKTYEGHAVYELEFVQIKDSPDIVVNNKQSRAVGDNAQSYDIETDRNVELNPRMSGTLLVDANTF